MEIFVRAWRDSDGDGIGDLRGLTRSLDCLKDLGLRGIWLMPITKNADGDHGYATTDLRDVAPECGTLADFDELLRQAHARGIGVVLPGDQPLRSPMSWSADARTAGFTTGTLFRPVAPNAATHSRPHRRRHAAAGAAVGAGAGGAQRGSCPACCQACYPAGRKARQAQARAGATQEANQHTLSCTSKRQFASASARSAAVTRLRRPPAGPADARQRVGAQCGHLFVKAPLHEGVFGDCAGRLPPAAAAPSATESRRRNPRAAC